MSGKSNDLDQEFDLKGHFLVAMPGMEGPHFARSVILICSHSPEQSMGFVLNQPVLSPKFGEILDELKIESSDESRIAGIQVFKGGPVEQGRGFLVHSLDYSSPASTRVGDLACVSATLDALRKLAGDDPPENAILLLGYAGWGEGQLEEEIAQNGWLTTPATEEILFNTHHSMQYSAVLAQMGISEELLSGSSGHA